MTPLAKGDDFHESKESSTMQKCPSFACSFLPGAIVTLWITTTSQLSVTQAQENARSAVAVEADQDMKSDVAQLQNKASDQAHAMVSVAYHFNNMWFARFMVK
jgi:hypothetical protein